MLIAEDFKLKCCIGLNGIKSKKVEGDKSTPRGLFRSRGQSISSQQLLDAMNYDGASMVLPEYVQQWMEIDRLMIQNQPEPSDNQ